MNKFKYILIFCAIGILAVSCNVFEPNLDNVYLEDRLEKDPAFAEGLLTQGYRMLPTEFSFNEVASDDAVTNNISSNYLRMATGGWTAGFNPMDVWSDNYSVIFYMNKFLSEVDKIQWSWQSVRRDTLFRNRFKGEALALRGYYHFLLLANYGGIASDGSLLGIPVIKSALSANDDLKLKRSSYKETVSAIIADLDAALALLPYVYLDGSDGDYNRVNGTKQLGRINGKIVKSLKARIALYVSSPAFNNGVYDPVMCELAAKNVEEVIGSTTLPATGMLFYDDDNDITNAEIIWRRDYTTINAWEYAQYPPSLYGYGNINPTQNLVDAFPMKNGKPINTSGSGYLLQNPYASRDPRLNNYIVYNNGKIGTRTVNTNKESTTDGLNNTTASTRTGYYLKKLLRPDVTLTPGATNTRRHFMPLIRFTELYLIYAEAANEAWGPNADPFAYGLTAKAAIAEIRKRAGIDAADVYLNAITTKEEMRTLIRNERRIELCFEGFRFWDIRRWGLPMNETAKGVSIENNVYTYMDVENRAFQPYMQFGPIPLNETLKNDQLIQNKGW